MSIRISRSLLHRIEALAAADPAVEICGILFGNADEIRAIGPTANVAADPVSRFEIDPAALFAAMRQARAGGPALLGHYHSHPSGLPVPSACDAEAAAPDGSLWLILGREAVRLWRAGEVGLYGRFVEESLDIAP